MALREFVQRIEYNSKYKHDVPPTVVTIVDTSKSPPLHRSLARHLQEAFKMRGDQVIPASADPKEPLPDDAITAIQFFDLQSPQETPPTDFFGRFRKIKSAGKKNKRTDKKAVVAGTRDNIPVAQDLTALARTFMGRRGGHITIAAEGSDDQEELQNGAHVLIGSMEGNTALIDYDLSDPMRVFLNAAARLAFLGHAEMVNIKEGVHNESIKFSDWINTEQVRGMQRASHILAHAKPRPLIWDIVLGRLGISLKQQRRLMSALKTAGLGEGMQLAVVEDVGEEPLLAITETGVSKTDADPNQGNVVALSGLTEFGSQYQVLFGTPKGHIINLFRHPSIQQAKDTYREILNATLRGNLPSIWKDMVKGQPIWIDHPGSIESHESALVVMVSALLEAETVSNFKQAMEYIAERFSQGEHVVLPVIPKGLKPGIRSGIHTHNFAEVKQENPNVRVIVADMEGFNYPHSPPCGSREAAFLLVSTLCDSYEKYGKLQEDEIRIINLPGHGSFTFSKKNIDIMAQDMATVVTWMKAVPRY